MAAFLRKYATGSGADIYIPMVKRGVVDHAVSADWTPAAGDVKISIDGGAAANIGTLPVAVAMGNSAEWKFVFTNSELTGKYIMITIADSATKAVEDSGFAIETYGNPSAMHPFDLGTASTAQTGDSFARLGAPAGASVSADILAIDNFVDDLESRLTAARAGYLDNLNVGGNVASSAEVTSIQNNTRVVRVVPNVIERPDSGTTTYRIELLLYDEIGNMETPDSAPTITLVNQAGTDLSARLDSATMALVSTGRYRAIYTASVSDTMEQLVWAFSVVEGGNTRLYGNTSTIVDTTAVDFTAADRTKLDTLHDTRLTAARATNLDNLDAAVSTRATPAQVNTEVDAALDTAIPATPTADSINERIKTLDDNFTATVAGRVDASVSSRATPAQVNTEVLDVVNVDTFAEPGQEAPAATNTLAKKIGYMFKMMRNKKTQTATTRSLFADDGTTVDQKATDSDDGTTLTKGELGTGP